MQHCAPFYRYPAMPDRTSRLFCLLACLFSLFVAVSAHANTPVTVTPIQETVVGEELALVGTVISKRSSRISPLVEGLIESVYVEEGQEVAAGDRLFRLDDRLAEIAVARAEAEVQEATARLSDVRRQFEEAASLWPKRAIPETAYESARIEVEASEAALLRLNAELEQQQELYRRHLVTAPFAGVIVTKFAEVGQWIRPDSPIFELTEIDTLRIEIPVPQQHYPLVQPGQRSDIRFDAIPAETFRAEVTSKIPFGRDQVRTFPVWIDFDNRARKVAPGMSARVSLTLGNSGPKTLVVPNDALVRRADGSVLIWLVREHDGGLRAEPAPVTVGQVTGTGAQISGPGLEPGMPVVIRGNETLRPNQSVRTTGPVAIGR